MDTNKTTLAEKTANYKIIARNSLRMELISPRLAKISTLEKEIEEVKKAKADFELREIAVTKYDLSKLDEAHPLYAEMKKEIEEDLEEMNKHLPCFDKEVEALEKEIADQKEGIAKIESGETLVSKEKLAALVNKMIEQDAMVQVKE